MIYFNENKEAFGYEIDNYICAISEAEWKKYASTDKWDIIDGKFTDISDTEEYKERQEAKTKAARKEELIAKLEELDAKAVRPLRAMVSGEATEADRIFLLGNEREVKAIREEIEKL